MSASHFVVDEIVTERRRIGQIRVHIMAFEDPQWLLAFLFFVGLIVGFIDSVAGGGGLISVPVFTLVIGPGALAIGTNKVAAVAASLSALISYARKGHVKFRSSASFAIVTGLASAFGATLAPYVPPHAYKWLIVFVCPVVLWIVYRKDFWIHAATRVPYDDRLGRSQTLRLVLAGAGCGFYDGIAGPGGGTMMFLSLLLFARFPLLAALATAKLANLTSAASSLSSYMNTGHVIWTLGLSMAAGVSIGAFGGAHLTQISFDRGFSTRLTRTVLAIIASLLALRLVMW